MDELPICYVKFNTYHILKFNIIKNVKAVINFNGQGTLRIYKKNIFGLKFYKSNTFINFSYFLKILKVNVTIYTNQMPSKIKKRKIFLKIFTKIKNEIAGFNKILHIQKIGNNNRFISLSYIIIQFFIRNMVV
jgi:hypothetical protein